VLEVLEKQIGEDWRGAERRDSVKSGDVRGGQYAGAQMDVLQIVQTAATVVGSGGVLVAAQAFRHAKRQETTSFEDALAREYREITVTLPAAAFFSDGVADLAPEEKQAMFRYFDLSNEQLRLIQEHRIDKETAKVWTEGICELMNLPTFATTWSELEQRLPKSFFTSLNAGVASPPLLAAGGPANDALGSD
jgi:hypothetical protein